MSRKNLLTVLGGCLLAFSLAGCSTVWTVASGVRKPWSGSTLDAYIVSSPEASTPEVIGAALDFPFSMVGDLTVMLFMQPNVNELINPSFD